ncbi:MAG TPA: hypothetical protein PLW88_08280, partial [Syntrophorhabdaceae bacterium]|nr:hypothetical protein [Syntrophorhabdaceae bacterium]
IEHGLNGVKEQGFMIVLGRCEDGLGNDDFLRWFDYPCLEEMERHVRCADKVYAQTAYATRIKAQYCNIFLISDLKDETVKRMGLIPAPTVDGAIDRIRSMNKHDLLCYIIPNGSNMLIL